MKREYEYLLHLLGAWLREKEPEVREDMDWIKLVQLAQIHCVTGILGYMSMSYPICPDENLRESLRSVCLQTLALYARRGALADAFCQTLEENGVDHIVMKGYVLRNYYPVPELRTFGDIDFVIRPADREKTHKLMLEAGFCVETDWEPVFSYTRDCEYYELHTEIMEVDVSDRTDYQGYFRQMWQYAVSDGGYSWHFGPEYHFLYLLTHLAKHITGKGAGVRMYLDLAAFIRHFEKELDWDFVRRELENLSLTDFAATVLAVVQDCFGVDAPLAVQSVDEDVWNALMDFTMEGGVFGHCGRDSGTNALKSGSRGKENASRLATFTKRLLPNAKSIQTRYTYLKRRPWLLPVAWIHRLVITRGDWRFHAEEAQYIMTADLDEVQRLKWLYEKIGL